MSGIRRENHDSDGGPETLMDSFAEPVRPFLAQLDSPRLFLTGERGASSMIPDYDPSFHNEGLILQLFLFSEHIIV